MTSIAPRIGASLSSDLLASDLTGYMVLQTIQSDSILGLGGSPGLLNAEAPVDNGELHRLGARAWTPAEWSSTSDGFSPRRQSNDEDG